MDSTLPTKMLANGRLIGSKLPNYWPGMGAIHKLYIGMILSALRTFRIVPQDVQLLPSSASKEFLRKFTASAPRNGCPDNDYYRGGLDAIRLTLEIVRSIKECPKWYISYLIDSWNEMKTGGIHGPRFEFVPFTFPNSKDDWRLCLFLNPFGFRLDAPYLKEHVGWFLKQYSSASYRNGICAWEDVRSGRPTALKYAFIRLKDGQCHWNENVFFFVALSERMAGSNIVKEIAEEFSDHAKMSSPDADYYVWVWGSILDQLPASKRRCDGCGERLFCMPKCTGCKKVSYCSVNCQRTSWSRHKLVCVHPELD